MHPRKHLLQYGSEDELKSVIVHDLDQRRKNENRRMELEKMRIDLDADIQIKETEKFERVKMSKDRRLEFENLRLELDTAKCSSEADEISKMFEALPEILKERK